MSNESIFPTSVSCAVWLAAIILLYIRLCYTVTTRETKQTENRIWSFNTMNPTPATAAPVANASVL